MRVGYRGNFRYSSRGEHDEFQSGNILKILRVERENPKPALDSLCGQPKILNSKLHSPSRKSEVRRQAAEHLGGFSRNPQKRLPHHPAKHGPCFQFLCGITHQPDSKPQLGNVYRRNIDGGLAGDRMDIGGADLSPLDGNPDGSVDQEAHGFRRSPTVPASFPRATALANAFPVASSSVR